MFYNLDFFFLKNSITHFLNREANEKSCTDDGPKIPKNSNSLNSKNFE